MSYKKELDQIRKRISNLSRIQAMITLSLLWKNVTNEEMREALEIGECYSPKKKENA